MQASPKTLYPQHFQTLTDIYNRALKNHQLDELIVYSGSLNNVFRDHTPYPFRVNAQFKALVPVCDNPYCWVIWRVEQKPTLLFYQPEDHWHYVPPTPNDYWTDYFDILCLKTPDEAKAHLGKNNARAFLGEVTTAIDQWPLGERNPTALVAELDWYRSIKSPYEQACLNQANLISVKGHRAAQEAFMAGASEFDISLAFQRACGQSDHQLPYPSIVGVNQHAAILHYRAREHQTIADQKRHSLLIDAGAEYQGYAADITRTYAYQDGPFADLISALNEAQLAMVDNVNPGQTHRAIDEDAFLRVGQLLNQFDLLNMSPESAVETQVVNQFMPHTCGHFLGLQVHDVGGGIKSPKGEVLSREDNKKARPERLVEAGQVMTIEPGIYFIDLLLKPLAAGPHKNAINWQKIDQLKPFGGIRIEDNIVVGEQENTNLTRRAFEAQT